MPVTRLRVLLSEASSLTAREHLTVLGTAGVRVEAMSSDPFALCRWSRWARQLDRCPASGTDPAGYLRAVSAVLAGGGFDALLPTHEQAWLFAVARDRLPPGAPVALAPAESFAQVPSKIAFARLLDELGARSHAGGRSRTTPCPGRSATRISSSPRSAPPGRASARYEHPQNTPARRRTCAPPGNR